jgi:putative Mg2+ transporter-C (MgtC) family protein
MHYLHNLDLTEPILCRLVVAALLGGLVGLEREIRHKPAGVRTNMFICLGAAMFTVLSDELAGNFGIGDHTRIAAQIIPGIGFIGAGAILRERGTVVGLTTAATIFVVASIGMAVGGGLYWTGVFASLFIILMLVLVGWLESVLSLKTRRMVFRLTTPNVETVTAAANTSFAEANVPVQHFQVVHVGQDYVVEFEADVSFHQQKKLTAKLSTLGTKFEIVPREFVGP